MKNIVIIDSHYLCWRGFYTTGHLTLNGNATGVLYAFMRDVISVQELFNPDILVFCFEGAGKRVREIIYPEYKSNRNKTYTDEELVARDALRMQIKILREDVLSSVGFKNVFATDGFEADDLIAAICHDREEDDITIISGDSDLYQLLRKKVRVYNPRDKSTMTAKKFKHKYGIKSREWPTIKAITGDKSDNIVGVKGVGLVNAVKYLRGELKSKSVYLKKIEASGQTIARNLNLIQLPFVNCPVPELVEHDGIDVQLWVREMERFGIKTLNKVGESHGPEGFKL